MAAVLRRATAALRRFSTLAAPSPPPVSADAAAVKPPSRVKYAIRYETNPDKLAHLFESSTHYAAIRTDRALYKLTIQKLSRARRADLVEKLLEGQLADPAAPKSEGFLIRLISLYSAAGMPEKSADVFAAMPTLGCRRSERSLCALLSAYLDNRRLDDLRQAFQNVPEEIGISPGIVSHNIFLQGLCLSGEVDIARKMLDEMPSKGLTPDIVSYNALLDGYLRKGNFSEFEKLIKEITEKDLKPNVTTYNCRISAFCKNNRSFEAEELLDVMSSNRIFANRSSFNAVIDGYCKEGNFNAAIRVYGKMKVAKRANGCQGVSPSFETYTLLLRILVEKGEFNRASDICKECLVKKWAPPFDSVKGLIEGLKKNSQVKEAKELAKKMQVAVKGDAAETWKKVVGELAL